MKLRRLDVDSDRACFVEAWLWEVEAAPWYKAASQVFGPPTFDNWLEASREDTRATFGIFDPNLIGMFILTLRGKGVYEVDFIAKPRCSVGAIVETGLRLRDAVFEDLGANEIFCWTPKINVPTRKLCAILGFHDSGLRLIRGQYRNKAIEWHRLSVLRPVVEAKQAA